MVTTSVTVAATATTATAVTAVEKAAPVKSTKSKKSWLKRPRLEKQAAEDSASQQEMPGTDHPEDSSVQASTSRRSTDMDEEIALTQEESQGTNTASKGVGLTGVPPPPPPSSQVPAATARETAAAVDKDIQAVVDLLVAEGLDGPPSNISTPGRSALTSSGGSTPQYFDLAGHKVMTTRREDRARDLFHGKVTLIMLQVETVSAVDLPEGRWGEFVLDYAHLHLLDWIQNWCDEDMRDDHPEVMRMKQPDGTWSFMADGVVPLILEALDLPPHTNMIQVGDEGAALSVSILPAEPPVMVSVTTSTDGIPMVMVQAGTGEPWSDSNLLGGRRSPKLHQLRRRAE